MKKKILVLGAGKLQTPVIKKARSMGIYTIAVDGYSNACGFEYADKAINADITDQETMLRLAIAENIDGIIHPCSEVSMDVMGYINDKLNLCGITQEQAFRTTNKHLMREAFRKANAPSPKSNCYENEELAWNAYCKDHKKECILKPSRSSGSRGITKISSDIEKTDFIQSFRIAKEISRDNSVMMEQFIDGPEFSVEIIVWENVIHVLTVTDKKTTGAPHFVELGHSQPSCYPSDIIEKVKMASIAGVKALEVNNCACHAEVKVQNGKAYIMEIGARLGGDFISTELTHLSTGIDMVAAAINCALGIEPNLDPIKDKHAACIRYFCPQPGILKKICNLEVLNDSRVYAWEVDSEEETIIPEITSSLCRVGHVIVIEESSERAITLADSLVEKVKFEIEK